MKPDKSNLTVIYYTSNYLEEKNPYFLQNTKKQLLEAIGDLPLITVTQKHIPETDLLGQTWDGKRFEVCVGDIGRSHINIYKQILEGAKFAKTPYVAMAEDDLLYSYSHFHSKLPTGDTFLYNLNRWSVFTWTKPPIFSMKLIRRCVNALIAPRQMLIDDLEERFARFPDESKIPLKFFGDPGRYERGLGMKPRSIEDFYSDIPIIQFSHPANYSFLNGGSNGTGTGERKAHSKIQATGLPYWGSASDVITLYEK